MAAKLTKLEPWVPQKHYHDAYSYVMKNGVSKIKNFFEEKLKNYAGEVKVKTAIVGSSGSGKSTFINRIRRWEQMEAFLYIFSREGFRKKVLLVLADVNWFPAFYKWN